MRGALSKWEMTIGQTDSPIEAAFLDAFCELAVQGGFNVARMSSERAFVITVEPQRWINHYRVDFMISYDYFGMTKRLVVECDGHEFHERTKLQAWRDKKRDRQIPHKIYRFTGAEIHACVEVCASEILDKIVDFQSWASGVLYRRAVKETRRKAQGQAA